KVDRASMAVALEVRPVYLHPAVLDVAARIPAPLLADGRDSKRALKRALRGWVPDSVLSRPKQGFAAPLGVWMDGPLRSLFSSHEFAGPLSEFLDVAALTAPPVQRRRPRRNMALRAHSLFF